MKQKLTLRRVLASAVAALAAAAAVWLLCRWVGYDLQLRIGNEPVYEIANDDYTQIIDVPEDGLWQAVPLEAGQTLYGCRLRFSTHGELYRAGMVMVDLCDADGTILREAAGNYANIFDDNFTGFAFGTAYTAAQAETLYLHIYNVVEWEGPLGLWASTGTVGALALTADGVVADATGPAAGVRSVCCRAAVRPACPAAADRGGGRPCVWTAVCARHPGARRAR